mmetsp:Transcript_34628/g.68090  ORF Transcript_34628/g.68090 Transcript_34628/m.68090 type:complete len:208 (-) Transcript_34628:1485-2108(-)
MQRRDEAYKDRGLQVEQSWGVVPEEHFQQSEQLFADFGVDKVLLKWHREHQVDDCAEGIGQSLVVVQLENTKVDVTSIEGSVQDLQAQLYTLQFLLVVVVGLLDGEDAGGVDGQGFAGLPEQQNTVGGRGWERDTLVAVEHQLRDHFEDGQANVGCVPPSLKQPQQQVDVFGVHPVEEVHVGAFEKGGFCYASYLAAQQLASGGHLV